ncbi:hypothetical protein CANCADRAFT_3305 [Tortispora caseinolytica NRRL Y-17796]|uniref:Small ribosomal subunit protein mS41 n=1 Tax=Tortispora caseinolytica NRRL Y-17796 TaxID=767744 RepID=A0A1E4TA94_9ASCO|nr:hypothetical protein CANCADRAFT_3305 [Tortispora caseinolytica NRRL Y-17796]
MNRFTAKTTLMLLCRGIKTVPPPSATVKDPATFLQAIGRGVGEYSELFESWDQLMTADSRALKELGVQNAAHRKYILAWQERFRQGREPYHIKPGVKKFGGERRRAEVLHKMRQKSK